MNRRTFMKTLFFATSAFAATAYGFRPTSAQNAIPLPPSLMLHSCHRRELRPILEVLRDEGYSGITYLDLENALNGQTLLPERPILITIDDLSMAEGNPSFAHFEEMKDTLLQFNFRATFGVITRPDMEQDIKRWHLVHEWLRDGMALENHTSYHSNLDNPGFSFRDYRAEIAAAAELIRAYSGQPVRTLITPYGSGYDMQTGQLNPSVVLACRQSNIRFVVGITQGREYLPTSLMPHDVVYLGRIQPWGEGNEMVMDSLNQIRGWYA
jgi:hypothetical protein